MLGWRRLHLFKDSLLIKNKRLRCTVVAVGGQLGGQPCVSHKEE